MDILIVITSYLINGSLWMCIHSLKLGSSAAVRQDFHYLMLWGSFMMVGSLSIVANSANQYILSASHFSICLFLSCCSILSCDSLDLSSSLWSSIFIVLMTKQQYASYSNAFLLVLMTKQQYASFIELGYMLLLVTIYRCQTNISTSMFFSSVMWWVFFSSALLVALHDFSPN